MTWIKNRFPTTSSRLPLVAVIGIALLVADQRLCWAQSPPTQKLRPSKGFIDQLLDSKPDDQSFELEGAPNQLRQTSSEETQFPNDHVQQAVYDEPPLEKLNPVIPDTWDTKADQQSFIEKERAALDTAPAKNPEGPTELAIKLVVNLALVLAIAVTVILCIKHWYRIRENKPAIGPDGPAFRLETTLALPNGSSLHLIEVSQTRFMVAIDGNGIKSIEALTGGFEETMRHMETQPEPDTEVFSGRVRTRAQKRRSHRTAEPRRQAEPEQEFDPNEDTTDIDEKLVKLLLRRSNQAA